MLLHCRYIFREFYLYLYFVFSFMKGKDMSKLFKQISLSIGFMGIVLVSTSPIDTFGQGTVINGVYLPEEMSEKARQYVANISPLTSETEITREDVAKALDFTWPIPTVNKNLATIRADIEDEVKRRCDMKYPPEDAEKFLDLMKRRFGTYKVGDWVSVQTHHVVAPYKGILTFIGKTYIKVDDTPVLIQDIKDKVFLTRLNKIECEKRINEEDQRYRVDRDARYKAYKQRITPGVTRKIYKNAGYINTDLQGYTGQWFEPITFVTGAYDLMSEELIRRKLKEGIELKVKRDIKEEVPVSTDTASDTEEPKDSVTDDTEETPSKTTSEEDISLDDTNEDDTPTESDSFDNESLEEEF